MKNFILVCVLLSLTKAHAQLDWKNYSTSFNGGKTATLGVAVPYNGIYDNTEGTIAGIAHWNPQYGISIDGGLADSIPLNFVYDTTEIYFLAPQVNRANAGQFEYRVLLDNKAPITPWSAIDRFTEMAVGDMQAGSGIMGGYRVKPGEYLVVHLRNKNGKLLSSWVIFFKSRPPWITAVYTADSPGEFSQIVNQKDRFGGSPAEIGWHRQYNRVAGEQAPALKLLHNENSVLLNIDAKIYEKEALEYALLFNGKTVQDWGPGQYASNYLLLADLDPGNYTVRLRYRRQRDAIAELRFSIAAAWYKTAAFRAAVAALLLLLLVLFVAALKYRRQKAALRQLGEKAALSDGELENIHALLNPHFTFNALGSIQGLVNKGDLEAANKYLSSFGALLRETLKESKAQHISLKKELENLEIYIGLEQLRYPFTYELFVDENIDLYSSSMPPFLLQPFVENAIKHGFSKMHGQGKLCLRFDRKESAMVVSIADNGGGFDRANFREGYGLGLSRKRIELINAGYGEELVILQMESTGKGTRVSLVFKNWL